MSKVARNARVHHWHTYTPLSYLQCSDVGPFCSALPMRLPSCTVQATYALLSKVLAELPASVEHLLVMSGVPVVFPQVCRSSLRLVLSLQRATARHSLAAASSPLGSLTMPGRTCVHKPPSQCIT